MNRAELKTYQYDLADVLGGRYPATGYHHDEEVELDTRDATNIVYADVCYRIDDLGLIDIESAYIYDNADRYRCTLSDISAIESDYNEAWARYTYNPYRDYDY